MNGHRTLTVLFAACCLLAAVVAAAQAAAPSPLLTKLPGQYKVGETEAYCFRSDGTVRHWGAWGERWGTWTASGAQGVITWTKDDVYKPAKPFRDAFNYYEEQGKAKLKLWSLDMPVPPYYGLRTASSCEAGPGAGPTGPGVVDFGGLRWDEWTVRNKVFGDLASDERKHQDSPWTVEAGALGYKGTGAQSYQNDFVVSQRAFDLGDVTVTFEATGSFRTEFGYCGPQVVFTDPQQVKSEGPFGPAYGVVAYYSWEPGKTDNGILVAGGAIPWKGYAAKFADHGDAEYRPYKIEVKGGKVTLTAPSGVYTAEAPTAKAGLKLPLVIALQHYDRGRTYAFKVRNLKVVEAAQATTPQTPGGTVQPVAPLPVVGPAFGKPCGTSEEFVTALFRSVLGREVDAEGLRYGMDRLNVGRTREEMVKDFFLSKEYEERKRTDEEFVKDAYRALLGREADAGGLQIFVPILQKARKDPMAILDAAKVMRDAKTKVLSGLADSGEYKAIKAGCK